MIGPPLHRGLTGSIKLLDGTLQEEVQMDEDLTALANAAINRKANNAG
jgi:ferritin-like metal-binding protein YciE